MANRRSIKAVKNNGKCGIIMPISGNKECPASHWAEVKEIISDVIRECGFEPNLVSDADEVGIIHTRIVNNIINNPIVICDVSSKNPNVMFELGMRLAFDKPTIVIKDNLTDYSFDTSPVEHLSYQRDLRYSTILEFKKLLGAKIIATHEAAKQEGYSTFLKNFVQYKPKIEEKEIGAQDYITKQLELINLNIEQLSRRGNTPNHDYRSVLEATMEERIFIESEAQRFIKDLNIDEKATNLENFANASRDFVQYLRSRSGYPRRLKFAELQFWASQLLRKQLQFHFRKPATQA